MAIFCLAAGLDDLEERLGSIIVGYDYGGEPVRARELNVAGAMTLVLREAIGPNLVQTLEGTPAFVHGGPFANIAHGCNSLMATRAGLAFGDVVITEAGFGSDLGAEKFFDIKCRIGGLNPEATVLVATIRALKLHGGRRPQRALDPRRGRRARGAQEHRRARRERPRLRHRAGRGDQRVRDGFRGGGSRRWPRRATGSACPTPARTAMRWAGPGARIWLGPSSRRWTRAPPPSSRSTTRRAPIRDKIESIARKVYGADGVDYTARASKDIRQLEAAGLGNTPVCIAKTPNSLSDDPARLGRPTGFRITVRDVRPSAGAGFVVARAGTVMTMPGLPRVPAAEAIRIVEDGSVVGLF